MNYYNNIPQENLNLAHQILDRANLYALKNSGCNKVQVGSAILTTDGSLIFGSNYVIGNLCVIKGCQRIELYGEDSKTIDYRQIVGHFTVKLRRFVQQLQLENLLLMPKYT